MSRAQGLPITTIIIAALGILVLVVIGAIFGGQIGKFGRAASECAGTCVVSSLPPDIPAGFENLYVQRTGGSCDPDFESKVGGVYVPKGMPRDANPQTWKCDACCVRTG